jgi:hypothetical protein
VEDVSPDLSVMNPPYDLSIEEIPLLGQIYPHLGHETIKDAFTPYSSPIARTGLDDVAMYLHSSGWFPFNLCFFPRSNEYLPIR